MRGCIPVLTLIFNLAMLAMLLGGFVYAQAQMNIQAGAWGDEASVGNMGVRAEIRTHVYVLNEQDMGDAFWVGDNLDNGGFIQFGYQIESPGKYCMKGQVVGGTHECSQSDILTDADVRWFWEYFPNLKGRDFYYGTGGFGSVGLNGTWHQYTITPSAAGGWVFLLDGAQVDSIGFHWTHSKDRVYVVAEKVSSSTSPGLLGPVEFRNVAYLKGDGWHGVSQLFVLRGCGVSQNCGSNVPYGVQLKGPNYIVAGSGEGLLKTGSLLWMKHGTTLTIEIPAQVSVSIDNVGQGLGPSVILELANGTHQITVSSLVDLGNGTRMKFSAWSDGQTAPNRTINLESDTILQAKYLIQYLVTANPGEGSRSERWYDEGSTVSYSVPSSTVRMDNPLGYLGAKWIFKGWYENGKLVTDSVSGSFLVSGPRELDAQWQPDVTLPIILLVCFAAVGVAVFLVHRRKRRSVAVRSSVGIDGSKRHELVSGSRNGVKQTPDSTQSVTCRYCGGKVPSGSTHCPECGLTVRFLGAD